MNIKKYSYLAMTMRLFSLASVVSCVVFAANRALSESLIIPSEFANKQGSQDLGHGPQTALRVHFLYLGSEFPQEPIDIIGVRYRPKSGTPTQTVVYPNFQLTLASTRESVLSTNFGSNFDMALAPPALVINGTVRTNTVRPVPNQSPRAFDYEFSWEETPFRFNPADGTNLLLDFLAPNGQNAGPFWDAINSAESSPDMPRIVIECCGGSLFYDTRFPVTEFVYRPVQTAALPGDYNRDGSVDAADYVVWRSGLGTTYTQTDYDVWRAHFGRAPSAGWSAGSGATLPSAEPLSAAVPEPGSVLLLILGTAVLSYRRDRTAPRTINPSEREAHQESTVPTSQIESICATHVPVGPVRVELATVSTIGGMPVSRPRLGEVGALRT